MRALHRKAYCFRSIAAMLGTIEAVLADLYLWLKAGHLIFAIFWIAGLFMLPRFFVYHHAALVGSPEDAAWIEREKRLKRIILLPSIIVLWVLGLTLAMTVDAFSMGWFHAKFLILLILSGFHGWMSAVAKKLAKGERPLSEKTLRIVNEVPSIAVILIVILAVVRPF